MIWRQHHMNDDNNIWWQVTISYEWWQQHMMTSDNIIWMTTTTYDDNIIWMMTTWYDNNIWLNDDNIIWQQHHMTTTSYDDNIRLNDDNIIWWQVTISYEWWQHMTTTSFYSGQKRSLTMLSMQSHLYMLLWFKTSFEWSTAQYTESKVWCFERIVLPKKDEEGLLLSTVFNLNA